MTSKRSGHFCYVCGRDRPNEKFSGWGHKRHICKDCASKQDNVDGVHDADLWEACPTVDNETVEQAISRYDDILQLALMLVYVGASQNDEPDDTLRCTKTYLSEIFEWLEAEDLVSRSKTGKSAALTELGYRVAEELLARHRFGEHAAAQLDDRDAAEFLAHPAVAERLTRAVRSLDEDRGVPHQEVIRRFVRRKI